MFGECVLSVRSTRTISAGGCSGSEQAGHSEELQEVGQLHALAAQGWLGAVA